MATKLNKKALDHARSLVKSGKVVRDTRDDWSEHAPSADEENAFIKKHGFSEFSKWHLGVDADESEGTKGSVSFPFGDFKKIHRCAVVSLESRAAQYHHDEIAKAAKDLLEKIDAGS
jgi:hypothetical protein